MKATRRQLAAWAATLTAKEESKEPLREHRAAVAVKAADEELRVVYGEVYAPDVLDSQGDFIAADDVRDMAWSFLGRGLVNQIDLQHDNEPTGAFVVESFVAREGDPTFNPGAWVVAVHVPDDDLWAKVKAGELNGFSLQALVQREEVELEVLLPDQLEGRTEAAGTLAHEHRYVIRFDDAGQLVGGETDVVDGHWHAISRGSVTRPSRDASGEDPKGHTHRYHFIESLLALQAELEKGNAD